MTVQVPKIYLIGFDRAGPQSRDHGHGLSEHDLTRVRFQVSIDQMKPELVLGIVLQDEALKPSDNILGLLRLLLVADELVVTLSPHTQPWNIT